MTCQPRRRGRNRLATESEAGSGRAETQGAKRAIKGPFLPVPPASTVLSARKVVAQRLTSVPVIAYSDATPAVTFAYERFGCIDLHKISHYREFNQYLHQRNTAGELYVGTIRSPSNPF